jgi:glycosyltransferase involved in cell wall biosynthesis
MKKIQVARVSTVPFFIDSQLRTQLHELIEKGFGLTAIASDGDWQRLQKVVGLKCVKTTIARAPAMITDVISVCKLYKLFKEHNFDIVHSTTPKAGLVCGIAAKFSGTRVILHTFTGQTWATKKGLNRFFLKQIDKLILALMTQCYADSESQKQFLIAEGIGDFNKIKVLGQGSLAGVDLERFNKALWQCRETEIKVGLGIRNSDFVITFIGRLTRDKGIFELIEAFNILIKKYHGIHLLLVGPCESDEVKQTNENQNIHFLGGTKTPEKYLSISSVLCLPSYREGFGTVVIEAAAMKVPAIGTDITGLKDAIQHDETGVLVKPKDVTALIVQMEKLILDKAYCMRLGQRAYDRCVASFQSQQMSHLIAEEYQGYVSK